MTEQQAHRTLGRIAERANVGHVNPHTLRRTYGSTLLNKGVRLEVVSRLLGHGNTKVTEDSYAELLNETITQEVLRVIGEGA